MDVQGIMPGFEHRRLRKHATVFDKMLSTNHFEDEATNKLPTMRISIDAVLRSGDSTFLPPMCAELDSRTRRHT